MIFNTLCPPALVYVLFSLTQIGIDTVIGAYNEAFMKIWITTIVTIVLNYLCSIGLSVISWIFVFVPFILMTTITTILILTFGLEPHRLHINVPDTRKHNEPERPHDPRKELIETKTKYAHPEDKSLILDQNKHPTKPLFFDNYDDKDVNQMISQTRKDIESTISSI